jgi:hypothetical protein
VLGDLFELLAAGQNLRRERFEEAVLVCRHG